MPILPRYLLRLFLPVFGAGLALFMGVLLMNQFLRLFTMAMVKGLPLLWILACFARLLPSFASLAVPMAFLVAAMVTLGQLSESGEIMALRASGFSFHEIVRPLLWLSVALSLVLLVINHRTGPGGFRSFKRRTTEAAQKLARVELRPRSFTQLGPWRLYSRDADPATGKLEGVYLVRPGRKDALRVNAERGLLTADPDRGVDLVLEDGQIQLPSEDPDRFTSGRFERYSVHVPVLAPAVAREPDIQEMGTPELRRRMKDPATPRDRRLEFAVETTVRSVGALAPFVLFWVAAPLGVGLKRRARGAEFAASLGVLFLFYGLLVVGVSLGRRHELLASTAPWLADAACLAGGLWLTRKVAAQ